MFHKKILNQQAHFDLPRNKVHATDGHSEDLFRSETFIGDFLMTETQKVFKSRASLYLPSTESKKT